MKNPYLAAGITVLLVLMILAGVYVGSIFVNVPQNPYSTPGQVSKGFVISTVPSDGDKNAVGDSPILITFGVPINKETLNDKSVTITAVQSQNGESRSINVTGMFDFIYDDAHNRLILNHKAGTGDFGENTRLEVVLSDRIEDIYGNRMTDGYTFDFEVLPDTIYEREKITEDWKETVVINDCTVKKGPGEDYEDIGILKYGSTIIVKGRYNGWYLGISSEGNEFWIKGSNIVEYDYTQKKDIGIVTAESISVGQIGMNKGNLVWILKRDAEKSYVRPVQIDINGGYSGWINNDDYTTRKEGIYFNQAFLVKDAKVYKEADINSGLSSDFNQLSGGFIFINRVQDDGWMYMSAYGGISGWVKKTDVYIP